MRLSQVISALCSHSVNTKFVLLFPNWHEHYRHFFFNELLVTRYYNRIEPCLMFTVLPSSLSVCIHLFSCKRPLVKNWFLFCTFLAILQLTILINKISWQNHVLFCQHFKMQYVRAANDYFHEWLIGQLFSWWIVIVYIVNVYKIVENVHHSSWLILMSCFVRPTQNGSLFLKLNCLKTKGNNHTALL